MPPDSVDEMPPTDESYLSILELLAYCGARRVEDLHPDPPPSCCGYPFATRAAWLQHQRTQHPGGEPRAAPQLALHRPAR